MSLKIVFMGTPEFAKELLEHLYKKQKYTIKAVYTQPPKKSHRGQQLNLSPVHKFAQEKKRGNIKKLYVTGCLSERYKENLEKEIPEVDEYFGTNDFTISVFDGS